VKLPRATLGPWNRLPGWERACVAYALVEQMRARARRLAGELGPVDARRRARLQHVQRRDRALLSLLLAVDPTLERHLLRWEKSVAGGATP
jgi:hypothetical protein